MAYDGELIPTSGLILTVLLIICRAIIISVRYATLTTIELETLRRHVRVDMDQDFMRCEWINATPLNIEEHIRVAMGQLVIGHSSFDGHGPYQ